MYGWMDVGRVNVVWYVVVWEVCMNMNGERGQAIYSARASQMTMINDNWTDR